MKTEMPSPHKLCLIWRINKIEIEHCIDAIALQNNLHFLDKKMADYQDALLIEFFNSPDQIFKVCYKEYKYIAIAKLEDCEGQIYSRFLSDNK